MFIISFKRADDLANAMEARGYYPGKTRSKLIEFHYRTVDYVVITFVLMLIPGVIILGL
jgi:energy-coupling factor transport system permease protein